ncbi:MAG: hypothetical protein GKR95_19030 [Gammaproteobacteria bacterium]|nr:hypothetical protein [Gammaproteobacteria bacterium]NKB64112.1 hypothetical protein [Gammaproteobacteria bacterium]
MKPLVSMPGSSGVRWFGLVLLPSVVSLLYGCSPMESRHGLEDWVSSQLVKKQQISPISSISLRLKKSSTNDKEHSHINTIDIFDLDRVTPRIEIRKKNNEIVSEESKRRPLEKLETYDLKALTLVGLLEKKNQQWGVIRTPDALTIKVSIGNYIGRNKGKVIRINRGSLTLQETHKNRVGQWIRKDVELSMVKDY